MAQTVTYSWNCGVEGPTDDAAIQQLRLQQQKKFAAILLVSHGVPMIFAATRLPHPTGQQQRLLPGQRNQLGGLADGREPYWSVAFLPADDCLSQTLFSSARANFN